MHEKIYAKLNEAEKQTSIKYMKILGLVDDDFDEESYEATFKKNIDLKMLLVKFGLIENNQENLKIINDFYDYLFKYGIKIGIERGKKLVINVIKEDGVKPSKIMEADSEKFTAIEIEPAILSEFKKFLRQKDKKEKNKYVSMDHIMDVEFSKEEYEIISNLKNKQLNILYDNLKIDKEKLKQISKKIITIRHNSKEYPFKSKIYIKHNGKYKFQTLLDQYHESILKDSMIIGMQYGKKFIIDDLQNQRFNWEYIKNMTDNEIEKYCLEVREDI